MMGTAASSGKKQETGPIETEKQEKKENNWTRNQQNPKTQPQLISSQHSDINEIIENTEDINQYNADTGAFEDADRRFQLRHETNEHDPTDRREATSVKTAVSVNKDHMATYLTSEEFSDLLTNVLTYLTKEIDGLNEIGTYKDKDDNYTDSVIQFVSLIYRLSKSDTRMSNEQVSKYGRSISKLLIDTRKLDLMCQIVIDTYDKGLNGEGAVSQLLLLTLIVIANSSDESDELSMATASAPEFAETIKKILLENTDVHFQKTSDYADSLIEQSLTILHNLLMRDANVARLRSLQFTAVLLPFINSPKETLRLATLASLAGIINEKESKIINTNQELTMHLMENLRQGLASETRRNHIGWSCKECGLIVRKLAKNDANKKLLVEVGALELLVELGETGNQEEQYESVCAIWELSFDKDNRKVIIDNGDLGAVELLVKLQKSNDSKIRKQCSGALWTLREELCSSMKYKETGKNQHFNLTDESDVGKKLSHEGHVMISYQWADQQMLLQIRAKLIDAGHTVWMDKTNMEGSTIEAMANAVERAKVVMMCMSQKYKTSPNCRLEAIYGHKLGKPIIPLKMEKNYEPDGWLGILCGTDLFYEFSGKYTFDDKMSELLRALASFLDQKPLGGSIIKQEMATKAHHPSAVINTDAVDSAAANPPVVLTTPYASSATIDKVRNWTKTDVQSWIDQHDLRRCKLDQLTGGEIAYLITMHQEAPGYFHKCLARMLNLKDLLRLSKIAWALHDISKIN